MTPFSERETGEQATSYTLCVERGVQAPVEVKNKPFLAWQNLNSTANLSNYAQNALKQMQLYRPASPNFTVLPVFADSRAASKIRITVTFVSSALKSPFACTFPLNTAFK